MWRFRSSWLVRHARCILVLSAALNAACGSGGSETVDPPPSSGLAMAIANHEDGNLSILAGERMARPIVVEKADPSIDAQVTVEGPANLVRIVQEPSGRFLLSIDASGITAAAQHPITIVGRNARNGLAERVQLTIHVLEAKVVATGRLTPTGGAVASLGGHVGVQVNAGQLTAPLGVTIRTAVTPGGNTKIRIRFDRDVSNETGVVTLLTNLGTPAAPTPTSATSALDLGRVRGSASSAVEDLLQHEIQNYPAFFIDERGTDYHRLAKSSLALQKATRTCDAVTKNEVCLELNTKAAVLTGPKPADELQTELEKLRQQSVDVVPVLFVHGYTATSLLGGGKGTWNRFPMLVQKLEPSTRVFVPFEFRWVTNASLPVVADDLANAIRRLLDLTGKPVRVVAHSFGGLLVRTLLQGIEFDGDEQRFKNTNVRGFDVGYVRSVLSLGTPHSGIFDRWTDRDGLRFPEGDDFEVIDGCEQISCYQAGTDVTFPKEYIELAGAGASKGDLVSALAASDNRPRDAIPWVAAIGMKRERGSNDKYDEGDGLITFNGQRFHPALAEDGAARGTKALLNCGVEYGYKVREIVLGAFKNGQHDVSVREGSQVEGDAKGYAHSQGGFLDGGLSYTPDSGIELAEPYVSDESHAAFVLFKAQTERPLEYCENQSRPPLTHVPNLLGYDVTITGNYPNVETAFTVPYTQVVGPYIEFVTGSLELIGSLRIISSEVDVGPRSIDITFVQTATSLTGEFSGLVFKFEAHSPKIIEAKLDPGSSFSSAQVVVGFSDHQVTINGPGLSIRQGDKIIVQLTLATPGS